MKQIKQVRISEEAHDILRRVSFETRKSMTEILNMLIIEKYGEQDKKQDKS